MRYGYARVSTRGQAREGTSLWDQEELLMEAGCEKIYKEAYSGKTMERPEMEKLMDSLSAGDEIYVTKLDRLARNTVEGIQFIDRILEKVNELSSIAEIPGYTDELKKDIEKLIKK